jgi:hypothetical protein
MMADCHSPAAAGYAYEEAAPDVAKFLKGQAERIRRYAGKCIIAIGKDLIAAKHYLSHGAFIRWVECEVGMPARTAQDYMRAAAWATGKGAMVAHLPPSLLYVLSASRTPKDFADEIVRRTEAGERLALPDVRAELRRHLAARRASADSGPHGSRANKDAASSMLAAEVDARARLSEAVAIIARALPTADFARVRDIMTDAHLLASYDLAGHMANAFSTAEGRKEPSVHRPSSKLAAPEHGEIRTAPG